MAVLHLAAGVTDGVDRNQPLALWTLGGWRHLLLPLATDFPELVKEAPGYASGIQH